VHNAGTFRCPNHSSTLEAAHVCSSLLGGQLPRQKSIDKGRQQQQGRFDRSRHLTGVDWSAERQVTSSEPSTRCQPSWQRPHGKHPQRQPARLCTAAPTHGATAVSHCLSLCTSSTWWIGLIAIAALSCASFMGSQEDRHRPKGREEGESGKGRQSRHVKDKSDPAPPSSDSTPSLLPLDAPAPCHCRPCRCPPCAIVSTGPPHNCSCPPDKVTTLAVWPLPSLPCHCGRCRCRCRCRCCCKYCCRCCCHYCCRYGCLLLRLWEQRQPSCKIRASGGD